MTATVDWRRSKSRRALAYTVMPRDGDDVGCGEQCCPVVSCRQRTDPLLESLCPQAERGGGITSGQTDTQAPEALQVDTDQGEDARPGRRVAGARSDVPVAVGRLGCRQVETDRARDQLVADRDLAARHVPASRRGRAGGGIERQHAEAPESEQRAAATQREVSRRLAMPLQCQPVADPEPAGRGAGEEAVIVAADRVVAAHGTGVEGASTEARCQQCPHAVDVEAGARLPAQRVADHDIDSTAAVDDRRTGHCKVSGRNAPLADPATIDQDVDGRGHRRTAAELRYRVGHQIGPDREVGGDLEACHSHRAAGLQAARNEVADIVASEMGDVGQRVGRVEPDDAVLAEDRAAVRKCTGRQRAEAGKQPRLEQSLRVDVAPVTVEFEIIIHQQPGAARRQRALVGDGIERDPVA